MNDKKRHKVKTFKKNLQKITQNTKMSECKKRLQKKAEQMNQFNVCPSTKG